MGPALKRLLPRRVSLRARLALVALVLLALPWTGYRYVREMERFLLAGQEQALVATSRAVATALHDRPQLMNLRSEAARNVDLRALAEQELRQLARERALAQGEPQPAESAPEAPEPAPPRPAEQASAEAEIAAILKGVERTTSRIWVVNRQYRVLALAGSLRPPASQQADVTWREKLLAFLLPRPRLDFDDAIPDDALAAGREINAALQGTPGSRVRNTSDGRAVVVSAAHPVWSADRVLGAVVVEETTNAIVSMRNKALEQLLLLTLAVFALAAAVILWFAASVSGRIRRLRDEAERAIDARGRVTRLVTASDAGDEIGDLSRSFSEVLARLAQHNAYLEGMASRLSHELRTPIAVVRSSLENLHLSHSPEETQTYIARAEEGLARLSTILSRMSEASRLEQGLQAQERERFDLAAVVRGCVEGYRLAYREHAIELAVQGGASMTAEGSPDLLAQMLDKLLGNAMDFAAPGTPVRLSLTATAGRALLAVENQGPPLPESMRGRLFESMVSVREGGTGKGVAGKSSEPHLGLGLYVARLITQFHHGEIVADNLPAAEGSQAGVRISVSLPLVMATA